MTREGIKRCELELRRAYGERWTPEQTLALGRSLKAYDDEAAMAGVLAWIDDTSEQGNGRLRGALPPTPAEIRFGADAHNRRQRQDLYAQLEAQDRERWEHAPTKTTHATPAHLGMGPVQVAAAQDAYCPWCQGRGKAYFWYDPQERERVWLYHEGLNLGAAATARLRLQVALCDCPAGTSRPEYPIEVARWPGRPERVPLWPRLSVIRRRAQARKERQQEEEAP